MINEQAAGECAAIPVFSNSEASTFARMLIMLLFKK